MINRILERVQLSISATRAWFHKYYVAMMYRWICCCFYFEPKSIFNVFHLFTKSPVVFRKVLKMSKTLSL